jgi:hypothetical protein
LTRDLEGSVDDFLQFLRNRIDEDAQAVEGLCTPSGGPTYQLVHMQGTTVLMRPARVQAEIDAKRRVLDRHAPHSMGQCTECEAPHWGVQVCNHCQRAWPCPDVRDVAAAYTDHHNYRAEWRS